MMTVKCNTFRTKCSYNKKNIQQHFRFFIPKTTKRQFPFTVKLALCAKSACNKKSKFPPVHQLISGVLCQTVQLPQVPVSNSDDEDIGIAKRWDKRAQ